MARSARAIFVASVGFAVGFAPAAPAPAEPRRQETTLESPARRAAARYQDGVRAYESGRFKDAIDSFREADALAPSPALSFNSALAHDKLLDAAGALAHYREYLRRDPTAPRAEGVRQRIAELEATLAQRGVQQLTVQSQPAGATVVIDDQPVGVTPWTGVLAPGTHALQLRLPGHADLAQPINLTLERAETFEFALRRAAESAPPSAAAAAPRGAAASATAGPRSPWPWVALGGSAASFLAAGAFELMRQSAERRAKAETTQLGYQKAYDDAQLDRTNARIFAGVGGGLAVTGVVLMLVLPTERSEHRGAALGCNGRGCFGRWKAAF